MSFGKDRLEQLAGRDFPRLAAGPTEEDPACLVRVAGHNRIPQGILPEERLFWMDMSPQGRFAYSDTEEYCNNKGFLLTGSSLKYLCSILNSTLITWVMRQTARTTGVGLIQWEKFSVERVPIPQIPTADQQPFVQLLDAILEEKASNPDADTSHLEWQIDRLVYDLYGLTDEEDTAIERGLGLIHATDEEEDAAMLKWMLEASTDAPNEFVSEEAVMATLRDLDGD